MSSRSMPPRAAASRTESASSRTSAGTLSVQAQICFAQDSEIRASARAPRTRGWAERRRIHLMAPVAAPGVMRVFHRSQVLGELWPSSRQPSDARNAEQGTGLGRGFAGLGPFQPAQAVRLLTGGQRREVGVSQPAQPGLGHRDGLSGGRGRRDGTGGRLAG